MEIKNKSIYNTFILYTRIFIIFLPLLSFVSSQHSIQGTVIDGKGNILPGANVFIESLGVGTIVDFDGQFKLENIENGTHTLTTSLISYKNLNTEVIID